MSIETIIAEMREAGAEWCHHWPQVIDWANRLDQLSACRTAEYAADSRHEIVKALATIVRIPSKERIGNYVIPQDFEVIDRSPVMDQVVRIRELVYRDTIASPAKAVPEGEGVTCRMCGEAMTKEFGPIIEPAPAASRVPVDEAMVSRFCETYFGGGWPGVGGQVRADVHAALKAALTTPKENAK